MTDPGYETLLYDVDGHVATITLNRPEVLNAINDPMRRELVAALRRAEADDDVWVVIITGPAGASARAPTCANGRWSGRSRRRR